MERSIDVYWSANTTVYPKSTVSSENMEELSFFKPVPVLKHLAPKFKKDRELSFYLKCPAASQYFKNMYAIKFNRDFKIKFNNKEKYYEIDKNGGNLTPEFLANWFHLRSFEERLISFASFYYFFSKDDIEITLHPPILEDSLFSKNNQVLPGGFNISKWFRGLQFVIKGREETISIKRGDVAFYVKFNTSKRIKLKNFKFNDELYHLSNSSTNLKSTSPFSPFSVIYDLFLEKNYNKRILTEIKNNLTGY